ncbi:hypothetical protein EUGRSUZ_H01392 [Eucalyptus grandis]|uniref:Uncharacterized protein n=2 Tax=Eucalyptus grandis TaxID=71139 RepID=A0ACC3JQ99_EUCGR|nr:hypothetical protein EUGRSUZ_H01392 [Eucalyptus grandis]
MAFFREKDQRACNLVPAPFQHKTEWLHLLTQSSDVCFDYSSATRDAEFRIPNSKKTLKEKKEPKKKLDTLL